MGESLRESHELSSASRVLILAACFVVVAFGMREAASVITPILIALVLAILFVPIQRGLQKRGVPGWISLFLVMLIVLAVVVILISITVVSVTSFINRIPDYSNQLQSLVNSLIVLAEDLPINIDNMINPEMFDVTQIMNLAGNLMGGLLDAFSNWFIVILLVAFMLADFARLPGKVEKMLLKEKQIQDIAELLIAIRRYVSITTQTGILTGVLNTLLLVIMGVDFAVLWGLLGFLMNYIPNLGIIISIIPPALLALLEFGWSQMLIVIIGYIIINTFIENILKPRVLGEDLNISPLFVLLSLVAWGYVLGPAGTILAVPLTLIATKLILENSEETRWMAILMTANIGPESVIDTDQDQ